MRLPDIGETKVSVAPEALLFSVPALLFVPLGTLLPALLSFCLHEAAHILTAKRLGFRIPEWKLLPFGATMRLAAESGVSGEWAVALAGPFSNWIAAAGTALMLRLLPDTGSVLQSFWIANLGMGVLNLLPVYPLDGGRLLRSISERRLSLQRARLVSAIASGVCCALLLTAAVYLAVTGTVGYTVIAFPAAVSLLSVRSLLHDRQAGAATILRHRVRLHGGAMEVLPLALHGDEPLSTALARVSGGRYALIWVLGKKGERLGVLGEEELLAAVGQLGGDATLLDALRIGNPTPNAK